MKKIIKPSQLEEVLYYCDFTGKMFDQFGPDVNIKIQCNYGSQFDGDELNLHLTDEAFKGLLSYIKQNLNSYTKESLEKQKSIISLYLTEKN